MKKVILPILALSIPAMLAAQTMVVNESFEGHASGVLVAQTLGAPWTTWSNTPGSAEDTPISDEQAVTGTYSMKVSTTVAGGGPTDMVLQLGDRTEGQWILSWMMFIPTGQGAYFNMQHTETPGTEWAVDVTFPGAGTAGTIATANVEYPITYEHDVWFAVGISIDLDAMSATMVIGNNPPHTWAFNSTSTMATGMNQIGGINFFAYSGGVGPTTYYIDDVTFVDLTSVGISEITDTDINVYPNPVENTLNVEAPGVSSAATAVLIDATGRTVIAARQFAQNALMARTQLDLSGLPSGMYFLRVQDGSQELVRRVTKF